MPVVSSTIKSSQISSAKSNAQTIELAIKEADAAISAKDNSVFPNASNGSLTLAEISKAKGIDSAVTASYSIDGKTYTAIYNNDDQKVYFAYKNGSKYTTFDSVDVPVASTNPKGVAELSAKTTTNNKTTYSVSTNVSFTGTGQATTSGGTTNTP